MVEGTTSATAQNQPQEEKQTNCLGCGKPLKKLKIYYRNGKYYCTKKCWLKFKLKEKQQKEQEQKEKEQKETPVTWRNTQRTPRRNHFRIFIPNIPGPSGFTSTRSVGMKPWQTIYFRNPSTSTSRPIQKLRTISTSSRISTRLPSDSSSIKKED